MCTVSSLYTFIGFGLKRPCANVTPCRTGYIQMTAPQWLSEMFYTRLLNTKAVNNLKKWKSTGI